MLTADPAYSVQVQEASRTVLFTGALRLTGMEEYQPVLTTLRTFLGDAAGCLTLDLRRLEFLNSSGIAMLSRFAIEARDQGPTPVRIRASSHVPWHARSLKNLQRLNPGIVIEME
jgi:hypothetical protein